MGIADNAKRELFEELMLPAKDSKRIVRGEGLRIVGILNDDSSPTGRKHFAVVFHYRASDDSQWDFPERGEKSITQLRWLSLKSLGEQLRGFEYWSQLCLTDFFLSSLKAQPSYQIRRRSPLRPPHLLCVVEEDFVFLALERTGGHVDDMNFSISHTFTFSLLRGTTVSLQTVRLSGTSLSLKYGLFR